MSQGNITDENNEIKLKKKSIKVLEPNDKPIKVKNNNNTFLTFYRENNSKKVKK